MVKLNKNFDFKYNKFNPSLNDWFNSIYSFNKNSLSTVWSNKMIFNVINSYFNVKPNNVSLLKKINNKFSLKRIFVSTPEIKHSLNSINIFVFVFNKEIIVFNKKIMELQKRRFNKKLSNNNIISWSSNSKLSNIKNISFSEKNNLNLKLFKNLNIPALMKKYLYTFLKNFNVNINNNIVQLLQTKIYKNINTIKDEMPNFIIHKKNFKNSLINNRNFYIIMKEKLKIMRNMMKIKYYTLFLYKRYITRIYFNKLKFNSINLINLNKILYKLYDKHVSINIINLKYLHLDNSIFTNAIVKKLKKRKSRILKVLRKALILPKIPEINSMFLLKKKEFINVTYDITNFSKYINIRNINKIIFKSLKNTHLIGIRLEGKGRLTRRLTASRAVYKKSYLGSLKNVYSSSKGLSSVMSRGFNKSNLNYVNLNSYNRNGSYGIKSWHNTM